MKDKKTFMYCEYCNKAHEDVSPPNREQYVEGFIRISDGSVVLLNNNSSYGNHSADLDGVYCNIACLTSRIMALRGGDTSKRKD